MTSLPWPVLNIRCTCMVQKPSHIWMLYLRVFTEPMNHQTAPNPHYRQPSPLCMAAQPSPIWKRTLVCLNYHTYVKSKGKTCMVQEPSHVQQLPLNHMCKVGLILVLLSGAEASSLGSRLPASRPSGRELQCKEDSRGDRARDQGTSDNFEGPVIPSAVWQSSSCIKEFISLPLLVLALIPQIEKTLKL